MNQKPNKGVSWRRANQRLSCREAFQLALAQWAQLYLICTNELRWAQVYHQCTLPVCAHIIKNTPGPVASSSQGWQRETNTYLASPDNHSLFVWTVWQPRHPEEHTQTWTEHGNCPAEPSLLAVRRQRTTTFRCSQINWRNSAINFKINKNMQAYTANCLQL